MTEKHVETRAEPIVTRLAKLSRADIPPDEFLKTFLGFISAAMAAEAGSIWVYNAETRQLTAKVAGGPDDAPLKGIPDEVFTRVVYKAIEQKLPVLYYPEESSDIAILKETSMVAVPIEVDAKTVVIVLLARRVGEGGPFAPENVHILQSLAAYLYVYFATSQFKAAAVTTARLAKLAEVESDLAAAWEKTKMAFILANRTREMMVFDRVFVAFPRGSSFHIEAVSGLDEVQQKTAPIQTLAELVKEFARIGGDWHFTVSYLEKVEDTALREKLTVYFETTDYRSILLMRLEDAGGLVAVIGYERRQEGAYAPAELQFLQGVAKVSAGALRRADDFANLCGIKAVQCVERMRQKVLGPQRHRFFLKIGAAVAAAAILVFGRMELTVKGDCRITPYLTTVAAARISGTVRRILKNEGDAVARGETIALLDTREIDNAISEADAQIEQTNASINYYFGKDTARWSLEKQNLEILKVRLEGLKLQKEFTQITSPQDGVIVTPRDRVNLSQDAAVQKGQGVCEVADLSRLYVEVEIAERDVGLVREGQTIEFVLSGAPGSVFKCKVARLSPSTRQMFGKNVFIAQGELDNSDGVFRPGVTGSAAIPVGRRPLVYVIFRSTIDWLRTKFL